MMMRHHRQAFTLLEILIAVTIAMIVLAGLYWAISIQLNHAQASREIIEESALTRSIFQKIQVDVERSLGPMDPSREGSGAPTNSSVTFNLGFDGTSDSLTVYTSRSARLTGAAALDPTLTDIRQITYQMSSDGDVSGLGRRDCVMTQPDDGTGLLFTQPDVPFKLVAAEVDDIHFRYLDTDPENGENGWVADWPLGASDYDGVKSIGPPLAVEVTLSIKTHSGTTRDYRHVISIKTANAASLKSLGRLPTPGGGSPP